MKPQGETGRILAEHEFRIGRHDNDILAIYNLLTDLQGTVDGHTATLAEHTTTLAEHGGKLDEILDILRARP